MSIVQGQLVQTKISAGSVAGFGQSLRTFVPEFQVCPTRPAFDYVGRSASPDSIDTETCPGAFPATLRIDVENSLRPFISPTYFNLPVGISGGADTMFGLMSTGRPTAFGFDVDINVPPTIGSKTGGEATESAYTSYAQKYAGNVSVNPKFGGKPYRIQPRTEYNN
jgi:hypothetical protein